jgi:predicted ATPase
VLVAGEAGIGKTALVEHVLDDARADGMQLLSAAGRELEQQYPYGVVLQLFERVVAADGAAQSELLGGAASLAGRLFATDATAGAPSAEAPAEPFPILHGLYWLVANLTERGPLVLAVDDAHWSDLPSLRVLHYLAQRIEDLPLCLLLTVRSAPSAPPDAAVQPAELAQLTALDATETLRLRELSLSAVEELAGAAAAAEVWRATRGNPFLIGQLLQQRADRESHGAVRSVPPETLSRWVLGRIDRAGRTARRVAEAIAVLGGAGSSATVAALADLDQDAVSRTVGALLTRGIIEMRDGLSFVHPIVQSVVYESIAPLARGRVHFRAAHLLAADPAGLDAAAVHLLSAPAAGDPWVVDLLAAAAGRAN